VSLEPTLCAALLAYLPAVNLATWLAFDRDKRRARESARRIPERTLLWLAAAGGSPAALLAQRLLRHKTRKQPFGAWLLAIVGLQLGVAIGLAVIMG
jgi:uncharacterized membrane protein YsdA (DUF1294 family)